jgi:hypothetical protein
VEAWSGAENKNKPCWEVLESTATQLLSGHEAKVTPLTTLTKAGLLDERVLSWEQFHSHLLEGLRLKRTNQATLHMTRACNEVERTEGSHPLGNCG